MSDLHLRVDRTSNHFRNMVNISKTNRSIIRDELIHAQNRE